jgi:hypothetical protein
MDCYIDCFAGESFLSLNHCCHMEWLRESGGERSTPQGVVAGTETLGRADDGATGGRAPTYCWRTSLRGSEGAPAISTNTLRIQQIAYTRFSLTFLSRLPLRPQRSLHSVGRSRRRRTHIQHEQPFSRRCGYQLVCMVSRAQRGKRVIAAGAFQMSPSLTRIA